jgi:hypothetical protein
MFVLFYLQTWIEAEISKALKDAQAAYAKELNKTKRQDFTF